MAFHFFSLRYSNFLRDGSLQNNPFSFEYKGCSNKQTQSFIFEFPCLKYFKNLDFDAKKLVEYSGTVDQLSQSSSLVLCFTFILLAAPVLDTVPMKIFPPNYRTTKAEDRVKLKAKVKLLQLVEELGRKSLF